MEWRGLRGKAASAQGKLVSNRYHLPLRPPLPAERKTDENVFVSLLCVCVFFVFFLSLLAVCSPGRYFFILFDSFLWFETKEDESRRRIFGKRLKGTPIDCLVFCFSFLLCCSCVALLFAYYLMNALRGSSESRDSFMTTAGQLYVNRDTDAVG
jgi:hypothetical protein